MKLVNFHFKSLVGHHLDVLEMGKFRGVLQKNIYLHLCGTFSWRPDERFLLLRHLPRYFGNQEGADEAVLRDSWAE